MLEFQWPWLLFLLPLPLLAAFLPSAQRQDPALRVPFYQRVAHLKETKAGKGTRRWFNYSLLWLIWAFALLAATNPQWYGDPITHSSSGRDLLLAVDLSGSMQIQDMEYQGQPIDRLQAVKIVVEDFVHSRQGDRLGLVLFGTGAYLHAPLTYDVQTVNTLLQETQIGFAGERTAIGDAIGLSVKRLRERPDNNRVLILLTDGANNSGVLTPERAAYLAAQHNVKIHTIAFGAEEMITPGIFGPRRINPSHDLDEEAMIAVAEQTGGRYFRARNLTELSEVHAELDRIEAIEFDTQVFRPTRSLFHWPLAFAFGLSGFLALGHWYRGRAVNLTRMEAAS
ncbi:VWA domain-containing protein [Marinimicrobium sp. ABcell2]|uniref:VWA domain-containing protein n=1 Tax=Marinimicrobium sp. ABcell2 TaxID=3069751 RepID=UPI0027B76C2A|nr:VWA domain-containing protein [Marinimicrobium sp. ABcell2]MDQ2075619.1 VWA domain-containing protein [Marinimicrobium sp. ABcell2]